MRALVAIFAATVAGGCGFEEEQGPTVTEPTLVAVLTAPEDFLEIDHVAAHPDGSLVLAGRRIGSTAALIRILPDNEVDPDFGTFSVDALLPGSQVTDLLAHGDGATVVTAHTAEGGIIARVTAGGVLDTSFGDGGIVSTELAPRMAATRSDGGVLVAIDSRGGLPIAMVLDDGGQLDAGVGEAGTITMRNFLMNGDPPLAGRVVIETDEVIAIGGLIESLFTVAVFHPDGEAWYTVSPPDTPALDPRVIAALDDGFVVGGSSSDAGGMTAARFNEGGGFDESYGVIGMARSGIESDSVAVLADDENRVLLVGSAMDATGEHPTFVRLLATGSMDPDFTDDGVHVDVGVSGQVTDAATEADGSVVVVGRREIDGSFGFFARYAMP